MFDSTSFGGYVGVVSAYSPNQFSMTLNSRGAGAEKSIENSMKILHKVLKGLPDIGVATRHAMIASRDYDSFADYMLTHETVVPMYIIMAGIKENQG